MTKEQMVANGGRIPFTAAVRQAVKQQSQGTCGICGCPLLEPERFAVDHIIPVALGGTNDPANLQAAHNRCNSMKSKGEQPGAFIPGERSARARPGSKVYDRAFWYVAYAEAMKRHGSNPFVPVTEAPDGGRFIRSMDAATTAELLFHGAAVTDRAGMPLATGRDAHYFVWPHVAARHPRYNGFVDTKLCPAKADLARFIDSRKSPTDTRERVAAAAALWLGGTTACQWRCDAAERYLAARTATPALGASS